MTRPVLREAVREDVPAIVALLADDPLGARREAPAELVPYLRAFARIHDDPGELLLVAEDEGRIVACAQLSVLPGLSRGATLRGQIEGVRVARPHRGTGLGAAVIEHLAGEAARRGCTLLQLTSDVRRPDAHRFYERLGFVATHTGFKRELPAVPPTRELG